MQGQQHLEPQPSVTPLNGNEINSNECVDQSVEGDPVTGIDQQHNVKEEEFNQYNINDKENIHPNNQDEDISAEEEINENDSGGQQSAVEMEVLEEEIEKHITKEARQDAMAQTAELPKEKSAKANKSLLLVQEFHTGLTSGDDSGESEIEEDQTREMSEKVDVGNLDGKETEDKRRQSVYSPPRPVKPTFVALKALRPDNTAEGAIARNRNLSECGLLFTRDEYRYYMDSSIVNIPANKEDAEYYEEVQGILAMIADRERKWEAMPMDQRKRKTRNSSLEPEAKRAKSDSPHVEVLTYTLQPYSDSVIPEPASVIFDSKETSPAAKYDSSPSQSSMTAEDTPPPPIAPIATANSKPKTKPNPQLAVLDSVLSNILRDSQQAQQKAKANEVSDLEAAALAAGLDLNPNGDAADDKCGPRSKLSKQEHAEFLKYNEMLKKGKEMPIQDRIKFDRLCSLVKAEKEQFLKYQCKSVMESGSYNTLDLKVEKLVKEVYELEKKRVHAYPQFYKYFNMVEMAPNATSDAPILAFKKCLFMQGQIAPCNPKMYDSPRNMNLFRKYLVNNTASPDEEEEHIQYYKKKLLPAIVVDPVIPSLIKDTSPDVIVSAECLTALVEVIHSISSDVSIPISVMQSGTDKKVLVMDRPFPRDSLTARAKNKIVYDLAFKSLCLDWKKRHPISANVSRPPSPNSYATAASTGKMDNDEGNSRLDENLQYNLWGFGDMDIVIRHQADGELVGGAKERRVCLTTKLDYQIQPNGFEEILTPSERASQWIQSYIGGHAFVLEGRIDVLKNRLVRVDQKQMKDIMSDNWKPTYESEMLRHTFLRLQKMLVPGNYILQHKPGDRNYIIYQGTDKMESTSTGIDLYSKYESSTLPATSNPELAFVPAWNMEESSSEQIPWTFPVAL
ncbi:Fructose-2,6-bisphosphatase [Mucor velutinosus]|uniref:Fructose-2,6-bisphosphatase n=1 Tax=Mucor velutinosus TaxID=708070 RepID=A0AAN7DGG2_9FUNG|nr:Fructose-2,6-bisphosphatase [Mucor velutinosus]